MKLVDGIPRRNRRDLWCLAEQKIQDAIDSAEAMGADVRLTDAVVKLSEAREKIADFYEDQQ